jgi:hypothetical protein
VLLRESGMITDAGLEADVKSAGLDWISARPLQPQAPSIARRRDDRYRRWHRDQQT